jgi:N-formylglutamate amidohydrolase
MKKFLKYIVLSYDVDILNLRDEELLWFFDDVNNFYVKDSRSDRKTNQIIDNYLVSLTHWKYSLPEILEWSLLVDSAEYIRLLKNFSDFWTTSIAESMSLENKQLITNSYSRWIWDCNRDIKDKSETGYIRKTDFSWNILFSDLTIFSELAQDHYYAYHNDISNWLESIEKQWNTSFLFDLHDTGVRLMNIDVERDTIKEDFFPSISIANFDGKSCSNEILKYFAEMITLYLWFPVVINEPYKWWYVTKFHGIESVKWKNIDRNVIQIELARFLYMKESTQEIDIERAEIIWDWLNRAMRDTVIRFS